MLGGKEETDLFILLGDFSENEGAGRSLFLPPPPNINTEIPAGGGAALTLAT